MSQKAIRRISIVAIFILIVAAIGYFFVYKQIYASTYILLSDTSDDKTLVNTPSPGADIDAVEITKNEKSYFGTAVASSNILDGKEKNVSKYITPSSSLGSPEDDDALTGYVSLGGGEIIIEIPVIAKNGDTLTVYEIGSSNNANPDYYDIYTSDSPTGPWTLQQAHASGTTTVTIGESQ